MELLIATANRGKAREFREMLGSGGGLACRDLAELKPVEPIQETGDTFLANACLKARGYAFQFKMWALADDSGLSVDALGGKPGVVSSRWAQLHGAGEGDAANNALLLEQLQSVPEESRTARFVCVLALADPQGRIVLTARGAVEGRILQGARGSGGFGYDPLFHVDGLARTTAELPPVEKHAVSHRGKALRRLRELMSKAGLAG